MITDEMVDVFTLAYVGTCADARKSLEVVAPLIRNQAYELAAARAEEHMLTYDGSTMGVGDAIRDMMTEVTP
jgi:hypothetical protein